MIPAAFQRVSDDAKRVSEEMNMHAIAGSSGWACFRLSDGSPVDHTPYPTRIEAVMHMNWDRDRIMYLEIDATGMEPRFAQACLDYARMLHDHGFRIPDPTFNYDPTMPMQLWDRKATIDHLASGGKR